MDATPATTNAGFTPRLAHALLPSLLTYFACAAPALPTPEPVIGSAIHDGGSAASRRACIRPVTRGNRLYRRTNDTLAYWREDTLWARTLPPLSADAVPLANGTVFHEGALHVPWQTDSGTGLTRIIVDRSGYRLLLDDGTAGPRIARQANGSWALTNTSDNYVRGSALAHFVSEKVTTDPRTLHHAADILESMRLRESELITSSASTTSQALRRNLEATMLLAVGQSFVENLPSRLRDPAASLWTPDEVHIIAPDLARHIRRPLAVYGSDGRLDVAVQADGTTMSPEAIPANAVRVSYNAANRYHRMGSRYPGEYPSIFAAVEADIRPSTVVRALDASRQEHLLRTELAATIEATSARPRLERMHQRWVHPVQVSYLHKRRLMAFSRVRQVVFDRNYRLAADEESFLLKILQSILPPNRPTAIEVVRHGTGQLGQRLAFVDTTPSAVDRIVIEADLDDEGRRVAYYQRGAPGHGAIRSRPILDNSFSPIIDVLLNTDNGRLRKALALGEWDFQKFADRLLAQIVDNDNALLPESLERLVVNDPAVLADAERRSRDSWSLNGRHYVRLRDLAGHSQVVEALPPARDGSREILGYSNDPVGREGGLHLLHEHRSMWMPSALLRRGFDPLSDSFRQDAIVTIVAHLPARVRMDTIAAGRIADAIPYPVLVSFMSDPAAIEVAAHGEMILVIGQANPTRYPTRMDMSGRPVPLVPDMAATLSRPATPLTRLQTLVPAPRLRDIGAVSVSSADIATFDTLVASGARVGEFIARGVGSPHVQALITARRWRRMLREDEHMVLVAKAADHVFTVAIPVNAASIQLTGSGTAVPIAAFPPGTRIIDDWYGVSGTTADYADRVRAVASRWELEGQRMVKPTDQGPVTSSPSAFTEQMLSSPVQFNFWSPVSDPINEARYLDYIHSRYRSPRATVLAGLDWLDSPAARSEYARYFPDDTTAGASVSSVAGLVQRTLDIDSGTYRRHLDLDQEPGRRE